MSTLLLVNKRSTLAVSLAMLFLAACGSGSEQGSSGISAPQSASIKTAQSAVPDANGNYPDANGNYPDANGKYPDANGNYPDSAGRYPDHRGLYPDSQGRYADWRGLYPNANGAYPTDAEAGLFPNESGIARSYSTLGAIDTSPNNPFFKNFGNGRTCATCHAQAQGFSITPAELQERFNRTAGTDPIFLPNDGSNSPLAPIGTLDEKRAAYSLLLNKGLIRVGKGIPRVTNDNPPKPAEFVLESVSDPYGYANARELSLFRRPLPSANLRFIAGVMWDNRETIRDFSATPDPELCINVPPPQTKPCYVSFNTALKFQANGATNGHAQAARFLTDAEMQAIVDFEMTLFTAQHYDNAAGYLRSAHAKGGPEELVTTPYYFDINSVFNDPKTGLPATVTKLTAMSLFTAWTTNPGSADAAARAARESIARGEKIFNTRTFQMVGVSGTRTPTVNGATCTNCHSTPQVGSLSQPNLFGLGIGDPAWSTSPDLPTYTFRNVTTGANAGKLITVQDPGLALVTGKWADIGKFKVPPLRGLTMRPPYFHDGSAQTIEETTAFYIKRFKYDVPLSGQDIADLNAFLKSL